jgi:hypothetical protein
VKGMLNLGGNFTNSPTLVNIFSAWLAPITAIVGIIYGGIQCYVSRKQLKNSYYNRRAEIYESICKHIATMLAEGEPPHGSEIYFSRVIKNAYFIFGKDIREFTDQIYDKTIKLQLLCNQCKSLTNEALQNNLNQQQKIKDWFKEALPSIEDRFRKYLKL